MIKFRHDIQILRGFSVLIVLLYHFKFEFLDSNFFKAGYIGVDIFFIISGYIITKILYEKKITIHFFFKQRLKRLLPALLFVIILSIIVASFFFQPFILKKNLNSTFFILTGVSNFYFWINSTVYELAEKNNLLFLHTWSLAIEFQFYLVYPFVLILFSKKNVNLFLIIISIISFILIFYMHEKHNLFNFYSSFSRVVEICFGCMAYLNEKKIRKFTPKKIFNYLYFLGLFLIIVFMFFFHNENTHPNPQSILFIFGTTLILIFYNDQLNFIKYSGLGFLGKISYSLYLWHFPLIIISIYIFDSFDDISKLITFIFCLLISLFSYQLLEKKFIQNNFTFFLKFFIIYILATLIVSIYIYSKNNSNNKYILDNFFLANQSNFFLKNKNNFYLKENRNIYSFQSDYKKYSPKFSGKKYKKVLFIGDSHSKDLFNIFYTNKKLYNNFEFSRYGINLSDFKNKRLDYLLNSDIFKKADIIFLSQRYKLNDLDFIDLIISLCEKHDKKLIISLKKPEFPSNNIKNETFFDKLIIQDLNFHLINKKAFESLRTSAFEEINKQLNKKYKNLKNIKIFDPYNLICDNVKKTCEVINNDSKNIYDYGHFTLSGSKYFGSKITTYKYFNQIINEFKK